MGNNNAMEADRKTKQPNGTKEDKAEAEQLASIKKLVDMLKKLPAPKTSEPTPQVDAGTVSLFKDWTWQRDKLDLYIPEYNEQVRQNVPRPMYDQASWCAFNLPLGTVVTLMENIVDVPQGKEMDLAHCGRCIDLVGTGETEAVDLDAVNFSDCVSAFFWRKVKFEMGAIELYEHPNFFEFSGGANNRSIIFLSEWNRDEIHSIEHWYLEKKVSSVRWHTLDRGMASLYEGPDGSGHQFNNIKGWGRDIENDADKMQVKDLYELGFNDHMSSFRWMGIIPAGEVVAPFNVHAFAATSASGLTHSEMVYNDSSESQQNTISLNKRHEDTVTASTQDQFVAGMGLSFSSEVEAGVPEFGSVKTTRSVDIKFEYMHSEDKGRSETNSTELVISRNFKCPPWSSTKATMLVTIGTIPEQVYTTTAQRWYDVELRGSTQETSGRYKGKWKRVEPVYLTMTGSLACDISVSIKSDPIKHKGGSSSGK